MYSPFDMDETAYSDCTSSSNSIYDRTSSSSPFDANATLRGLPSKSYFDISRQMGEGHQWHSGPHGQPQPLDNPTKSSLIEINPGSSFGGTNQLWSSQQSTLSQQGVQSYDVGFWPVSQDGIIVRGVDPEPLNTDFAASESLETQSVYLHPKFSYPQPLPDCDAQSLTASMSRRLSNASTSISADIIPYDNILSSQENNGTNVSYNDPYNSHVGVATISSSTANPSPLPSPRNMTELVRVPSRGKASPSPRQNSRLTPYSIENRNKRWSTGMNLPNNSPFGGFGAHVPSIASTLELGNFHSISDAGILHTLNECSSGHCDGEGLMYSPYNSSIFQPHRSSAILPTQPLLESQVDHSFATGHHSHLRMLQSNVNHHCHYGDISDPPDLYAALAEEQLDPPEEDMNPEDPDMKPHEQELRFEGDLYTPKWVRNHGNKREGWCGICKPGRWLVLKNSAFWYDKSFTHGISAATGQAFMEPQEVRRVDGNPDVWEGLCHSCHEWISLISNKKKGTTWFRHAYKCHVHQAPKIKGTPKRRIRDSRPGTARSSDSI
ncbi:hypothetical protein TWF694_007978 [Orbilia ellipsospora]|uniref:Transcription regulator Rua1 C-terminal domain-containing protein n=1 Tax=Orbilia ellipsospora TaxID=2528407 RepID=A0AAV9XKB1_9PEZI